MRQPANTGRIVKAREMPHTSTFRTRRFQTDVSTSAKECMEGLMLTFMSLGGFATSRDFRRLLASCCRETRGARWKQWKLYKYEKDTRTVLAAMNILTSSIAHYLKGLQNHDLALNDIAPLSPPRPVILDPIQNLRVVPVIADLIRNPEGRRTGPSFPASLTVIPA